MAAQHWDRKTWAIALISFVVLFHMATFFPVASYLTRTTLKSKNVARGWGNYSPLSDEILAFRSTPDEMSGVVCVIDPLQGTIRDLNVQLPPNPRGVTVVGNTLWLIGTGSVIEWDGIKTTLHQQKRLLNSPLGSAFPFEGRPAIVDLDDAGVKYRLRVFNEGKWQDRGEVAIPPLGSTWKKDPQTGATKLCPPTATSTPLRPGGTQGLQVIEAGGIHRICLWDHSSWITAYRDGLERVDQESDVPSASSPENAPAESTGWIDLDTKPGLWGVAASKKRMVMVTQESPKEPIRFLEKELNQPDQAFRVAGELKTNGWETLSMLYLPNSDEWYFIRERDFAPKFYRYQLGELREVAPLWDNELTVIMRQARPAMGWFAGILIVGLVMLIAGAEWINRSEPDRYQFGLTFVQLAPIWRRCVARGIDLTLVLFPVASDLWRLGIYQIASDGLDFCNEVSLEQTVTGQAIGRNLIWVSGASFVLVLTQGLWGLTPGKWLCGLRVRAATLRRCGFARSLLREFGFLADAPGLLTVIPGIASMLCTDQRVRLGDQLSDTVVVTAKSLNASQSERPLRKVVPETAVATSVPCGLISERRFPCV